MPEVVMVSRMLLWHSRKNSTGTAMMMNVTAAAAPVPAATTGAAPAPATPEADQ